MTGVDKQRAIGALLGSAVGDALGAPFEFGAAGAFTKRFPTPARGPATEMIGGGMGWEPGEFTDDTQMAVILGESLLAHGALDGADVFERWGQWAATAKDVGSQTREVLSSGDWGTSATRHFERTGRAAGNGSLMRATTSALFAAGGPLGDSIALARAQSALTHGDPAAGWGAALYHGMIHASVRGQSPLDALEPLFETLPDEHACRYRDALMSDEPLPGELRNGTVWTCLAQAVRVLRRSSTFERAMQDVCDVGDDVDTVACVTGGLAGATFGMHSIPARWLSHVHGRVAGKIYRNADLQHLALSLIGETAPPLAKDLPLRGPIEISPGVFAANTLGAVSAPADAAILSFCRVGGRFDDRLHRREFFIIDQLDANRGLTHVLHDALDEISAFREAGIAVVIHCHAGESRTAFILRAWLMRHEGLSAQQATDRLRTMWPHMKHHNTDFETALENLAF